MDQHEYDDHGRLLQSTEGQEGALTEIRYSYDDAGRLIQKRSTVPGSSSPTITQYEYDSAGRLFSETSNARPGDPIQFTYDALGRKTKIIHADPNAPDRSNMAMGTGAMLASAQKGLLTPPGGRTEITYDEHDRPITATMYAANGTAASRITATYTPEGQLQDQSYTLESFSGNIPADQLKQLLEKTGASREQFEAEAKAQLREALGGNTEFSGVSYRYDSSGRVIEEHNRMPQGASDQVQKTTYNDHGDLEEVQVIDKRPAAPGTASTAVEVVETTTRYAYVYDSFGNWTEETVTTQTGAEAPQVTSTTTRKLTYF